jgi:hypothetical protein
VSRKQVRTAVTDYIAGAGIPYLGKVFPARTYVVDMTNYTELTGGSSANGSDSVMMVNIPSDNRRRVQMTGRQYVNEPEIHPIALEIFFGCSSGEPVDAQLDYDDIVDALFAAIRGNPQLGSVQIWSAGEFTAGVKHRQSEPFTDPDGLTVLINGVFEFEAWEWLAAPAGTV